MSKVLQKKILLFNWPTIVIGQASTAIDWLIVMTTSPRVTLIYASSMYIVPILLFIGGGEEQNI
jgi:hypothetical protein